MEYGEEMQLSLLDREYNLSSFFFFFFFFFFPLLLMLYFAWSLYLPFGDNDKMVHCRRNKCYHVFISGVVSYMSKIVSSHLSPWWCV